MADLAVEQASAELAAKYAKADEMVLSKLRAKLGLDQVDDLRCGADPAADAGRLRRTGPPDLGDLGYPS